MTQKSKTLESKTVPELAELRVTLLKRVASNPVHSGLDRAELEDVEGLDSVAYPRSGKTKARTDILSKKEKPPMPVGAF